MAIALPAIAQAGSLQKADDLIRARDYQGAFQALSAPDLANDPGAIWRLSSLYEAGLGVAKDKAKANELIRRAADLGQVDAQYRLGRMLLDGDGATADRTAGLAMLEYAAAAGHVRAAEALVATAMAPPPVPPAQVAAAPAIPVASKLAVESGWTPLMEAAQRDALLEAKALLDAGAPVEQRDKLGQTALMHAASRGSLQVVRLLLEHGAAVDATDQDGRTALTHAIDSDQAGTVEALLDAGALLLLPDASGATPLEHALSVRNCAGAMSLLSRTEVLPAGDDKRPGLARRAAESCGAPVLGRMTELGIDLKTVDAKGRNPLWYAAAAGNTDGVAYLAAHGNDPVLPDDEGMTPLLAAAAAGHGAPVKALVGAGADLNATTRAGNTALILLAEAGEIDGLRALIEAGAAPDTQNQQGETALMVAARAGRGDAIGILLAGGANARIRNLRRERAGQIALTAGHPEIADLFK